MQDGNPSSDTITFLGTAGARIMVANQILASGGLCHNYSGELLIINVVRLEGNHPFDHLSVPDAKRIITTVKPKVAILTHFGMTMWRAKPWEVALRLSQDTGVKVIAARDGMKFDLPQLDNTQSQPNL